MNPGRSFNSVALLFSLSVFGADYLPSGVVNTQKPGDAPISPKEALAKITVPDGFQVSLFAGEPEVMQPIAFEFDDRGRLWVVECFSYPDFKTGNRDRILIFEDRDGDGRFDERTVFYDRGDRFTGIQLGYGGVWVTAPPHLLFHSDKDGDDVPDREPEVLLDGFTTDAKHNFANGMAWGPDGWLWGRHGILAESSVGKPGSPDSERVKLECGIWRYHPWTERFEVVVHGTTNPWGLDWDDHGQAFFSNNVIGHLWHVVHGARFERMYGEDYNPHSYELMKACSDHLHWTGPKWQQARGGPKHDALGGGHSHCGGMIYLGDNWPDAYRGLMFMNNIHGNRMLYDRLERKGSGFVATCGDAFLNANDPWFRGVSIGYGPDGGVFVSDWNDFGECHDNDGSFKGSGRIYKISYGATRQLDDLDLATQPDAALVEWQLHKNDWYVRHARRILHERAIAGTLDASTNERLKTVLAGHKDVTRRLRALWCLNLTGGINAYGLIRLLSDSSEHVRYWAVSLLIDRKNLPPGVTERFAAMAESDESALVRLALASTLQRLPLAERWPIATALLSSDRDAEDQNIPLLTWYGIEPAVAVDRAKAIGLVTSCRVPKIRQYITRRMAAPKSVPLDRSRRSRR